METSEERLKGVVMKTKKQKYDARWETTKAAKDIRRRYNKTGARQKELARRSKIYRKPTYNRSHYVKYTPEDCEFILNCTASVGDIAQTLGRSIMAIIAKRSKLIHSRI